MKIPTKPYRDCWRIVLGSIALLPLPLLAAPHNEVKVFKDWAVACNNIRACEATSFMFRDDGSEEMDALLNMKRGGKPADAPAFSLLLGYGDLPDNLAGQPIQLQADGKTLDLGKLSKAQINEAKVDIPVAKNAALLNMLRKPALLKVVIGAKTFRITLNGLAATLLYVDDRQQRLDTTSALLRKGGKTMTARPPAVPVLKTVFPPKGMKVPPGLAAKVRKTMAASLKDCMDQGDLNLSEQDFAEALDANHYLVGIACYMGAYNLMTDIFVVNKDSAGSAKPQAIRPRLEMLGRDGSELVNADFDAKTNMLSEYSKGRGLGDCGSNKQWVWTGRQFSTVLYNDMPACRGVVDFLNLWTAKTAKLK